jgi:8-oxo-dGTP diphosphatase
MPQDSHPKEIHVVAAVIIDDDGKILVTQRGKGMKFEGKWEFPGGKVHDGEEPKAALKREIQEELMLDIEVGEELLTWQYNYSFAQVNFTAFRARVTGGNLELVEHMASIWAKPEELESFDWVPADVELVSFLNR